MTANNGISGIKKVLDGILLFRKTVRKDLVKQFEKIRDNPNPTAVFFTCMDSRILPARFTQAQVGDMFVVRNSGNMIPLAQNFGKSGYEVSVTTEPAALELAIKRGGIRHVILCGHSDCKAINTLHNLYQCPHTFDPDSPTDHWLRKHGHTSVEKLQERLNSEDLSELSFCSQNGLLRFTAIIDPEDRFNIEDKLSQINTLQQLTHIASHGFLREYIENNKIVFHALWFDVYTGNMHMFSQQQKKFVLIDETTAPELLQEIAQQTS